MNQSINESTIVKSYSSYIIILLIFIPTSLCLGQWVTNTIGTQMGAFGVNGKIKVTSSRGSVAGDNNYEGFLFNADYYDDIPHAINLTFVAIPPAKQLKVTAGVPFDITLEIFHKYISEDINDGPASTHQVFINYFPDWCWDCGDDLYSGSIRALFGQNEQPNLNDTDDNLNSVYQYIDDDATFPELGIARKSKFTGTFTFDVAGTRGWIVIGFREKSNTLYNQSNYNNLIILPFVVDGIGPVAPKSALVELSGNNQGFSLPCYVKGTNDCHRIAGGRSNGVL